MTVNGPELLSDTVGEAEGRLRRVWSRAAADGGLLFLDEVDALCPSRDSPGAGEVESRVLAQLCALMDGQGDDGSSSGILVIGATNRPGALDAALRRPGRFDLEISVGVPTAAQRCEILWACLGTYRHCIVREQADALCQGRMHGFVGADVAAACREGAWCALRRSLKGSTGVGGGAGALDGITQDLANMSLSASSSSPAASGSGTSGGDASITLADLSLGLSRVQPSALRDTSVEVASTPWSSIAGSESVKDRLVEAIEWPSRYPALFASLGVTPTRGILLYGPPGCSKTMMARAMATSGSMNFISVKGPELLSKYVGDSEKAVAGVFVKARAAAPCVLFFDEFDSLGSARGDGSEGGGAGGVGVRVVAQLLQEMDGTHSRAAGQGAEGAPVVVVVAATNRPDLIDPALLRPGRMDYLLYVGLPSEQARAAIASAHLDKLPVHLRDGAAEGGLTGEAVARVTEGCSGAEVVGILREAASRVLQEAMAATPSGSGESFRLTLAHVMTAAKETPKQVTAEMLTFYSRWEATQGRR